MKVKVFNGYTQVTTAQGEYHYNSTDPAELIAKATKIRERAADDLRRAELVHCAALALMIDNQRRAIEAATQKRERAAATRQRNKDARWWA